MFSHFTVFTVLLVFASTGATIQKCHFGDLRCIEKTTAALVNLDDGYKEMNVPKLKNFNIKNLRIIGSSDRKSPFSIDLTILESNVTGFENLRVLDAKGFDEDIKGPHSISFKTNATTVVGTYLLEGHGSILKLQGGGPFKIVFIEPLTVISFKGVPKVKDGKTYMKVVDFKADASIKKFDMKFEKIFKDKALTDNANFFLNEYGQDFYEDFKGVFNKELSSIFKKIVAGVMDFTPYEDLFLKKDEVVKSEADAAD